MMFSLPQRKSSHRLAFLPAVLLAASVNTQNAKQEEPVPSSLIERDEVRFVTLDLSVDEKAGRRWSQALSLRQDQVTVSVGGKPVDLDLFENWCRPNPGNEPQGEDAAQEGVRPGKVLADFIAGIPEQHQPPSASNTARYILYFDLTHLKMEGLHLSIKAALEWNDTQARPEDEVMIVTGGRGLRIFRPLWPARHRLREDILALETSHPLIDSWAVSEGDGNSGRIREVLDMPPEAQRNLANSYAALDFHHTRNSLENLEGLMALFESIEGTKNLIFFQETIRQLPGDVYPRVSVLTEVNPFLRDLATAANERNVRIYPVHASGLTGGGERGSNNALFMLASETGGQYIHGTNRLATVIERAAEDATCFYRVGFRVRPQFSGGTKRIVVRIEGGRYRVRHRRTLHDPTRSERDRDRLRAAFLDPDAAESFPVSPAVTTLYSGSRDARVRIEVSVARADLLDLAAGTTTRHVRVQVGGTVIPLVTDLADSPQPLRPQAWIDADPRKKPWSFARQSVLRLSPDHRRPRDLVLVQEAKLPIGDYRLVAVVQDQLAQTISTGTVDFSVQSSEGRLGTVRLAQTDPAALPIEPTSGEAPEDSPKKSSRGPRALAASLPTGSLLSDDSTLLEGQAAWLVYSLCDPPENREAQQFAGWALERTLVCNQKPAPPITAALAERDPSSDCVVVVDPLPSGLTSGTCQAEVTLERPDAQPETRTLTFHISAEVDPEPQSNN